MTSEVQTTPNMLATPAVLLRVEGAAMFACSVFLFYFLGGNWIVFVALLLWPDLFMLGYLANAKLGARVYNLVHTDVLPLALATASLGFRQSGLMAFDIVWLVHNGIGHSSG